MNRTALALFALASAPAFAQIVNGSFETGQAYVGAPIFWSPGTPAPWYATSFTPDMYDNTGADGWNLAGIPAYNGMFSGVAACDGNRFIGIAASTSFGGFSESFAQVTAPLVAGQSYTLNACMAVDDRGYAVPYGGPFFGRGEIDVFLDNNLIGTFSQNTASLTWEARSITFTATSSLPATFEFFARVEPLSQHASYMALDGIRLIPAPGSVALLGLGGLLGTRRR